MKPISRAVLAVVSTLALSTSAHAAAWTQLDITGDLTLSQGLYETGSSLVFSGIPYTVRLGEAPQRFTVNYELTMGDTGLPVSLTGPELASYSACETRYPVMALCPPAPTGYESAFAHLSFISPHEIVPPNVNVSISGPSFLDLRTERGAEPDFISRSGTVTIDVSMVEGFPNITEFSGFVAVYSDQWVVASPIPEPETYALMLGGLGAVLTRRRARSNWHGNRSERLTAVPQA